MKVKDQKQLIPDDAVRDAFFARPDIRVLSPDERNRRWIRARINLDAFREQLSGYRSIPFKEAEARGLPIK